MSQEATTWCEIQIDFPLLMEEHQNHEYLEHVIEVVSGGNSSLDSSSENSPCGSGLRREEDRPLNSIQVPLSQSSSFSSSGSNSRASSIIRRHDELGCHRWISSSCSLWFLVEFVFTMSQIIASIVVLSVSRHEKPQSPLFVWIAGYAAGCTARIPVLFWHCLRYSQSIEQSPTQSRQGSPHGNSILESNPYITISLTWCSEEEDYQNTSSEASLNGHSIGAPNARLDVLIDHLKMALDCFFAVWFVVGNVWILGGHDSSSEAPILYRLCIVFLSISCIGYAMPFILCAIICCCLPCIISILAWEELNQMRGATAESINALPAYKFKLKKICSGSSRDNLASEGGVAVAETEREHAISAEDAVCCICLARYADDDELRELPCSHFFHTGCVDKWLKINATCPLCKFEVGESKEALPSGENSNQQM